MRMRSRIGEIRLCVIIAAIIEIELLKFSSTISCYDCRSEDISCNVGECNGATCVKMETSNIDNERKTVSKSCSSEYEDNQCKQSYLGPKGVLRCTCDSNFCNGDRNLVAAGLQRMSNNGAKITFKPALLLGMLVFLFALFFSHI